MSIRLDGKVALVTGATKGIGRSIVLDLAMRGANIVAIARGGDAAAGLATDIEAGGGEFRFVQGDVANWDDCQRTVQCAVDMFGRLDILVNNAATSHPLRRVDEISEQDWRTVSGPTLDGVLFMCRAALPQMRSQKDGVILNIASGAGEQALERFGAYCASKAAVIQLSRVVGIENGGLGVRCNALIVGATATGHANDSFLDMGRQLRGPDWMPDQSDIDAAGSALSRIMLMPQNVAAAVAVLCADEAREINASTIAIDRGMQAGLYSSMLLHFAAAGMIRQQALT